MNAVGYPVHAVATYREWVNPHQVSFVDWTAACGASGTSPGYRANVFKDVKSARRAELCKACWPAGHNTFHPKPRQVEGGAR